MKSLFEMLVQRGFVADCTGKELRNMLSRQRLTVYTGFDPTADSLHLGHLVPLMMLAHFQRAGHKVIAVVGGATARVGDPSGRQSERVMLDRNVVRANAAAIEKQLGHFLAFDGDNAALCLNNLAWLGQINLLDFMCDPGKLFSINRLLTKESVKKRLDSESHLSWTEFNYQILQAFDFLHLFDNHDCTVQCGGSDQWGNIVEGIELIRKKRGAEAFGITCPLVTTASGEKFGKSAGNAVWLDAARTSPWDFFQFFVRQADADVVPLLKRFTFLPEEEIDRLEASRQANPALREAQRALAFAVTGMVHGETVARQMQRAADVLFKGDLKELSGSTLEMIFASVPSSTISADELDAGIPLSALLDRTGLAASLTKARQLITGGGANINNTRATTDVRVCRDHLLHERHIVLRVGKTNQHLIRLGN